MLSNKKKNQLKDLIAKFGMAAQNFASEEERHELNYSSDVEVAKETFNKSYTELMFFINHDI